ncbi:MAG TPA: CotH kinase family protein [Solirubrobacterales bacterium]
MTSQSIDRAPARRIVAVLAACLAALALLPVAAGADALYDPGTVWVVDLQLPQASVEALEADPEGAYQPGTFSVAASDGTPGGVGTFSAPQAMEIRLKGSASFKPLSGKAAFKIKFPKAGPFMGLRKMTLNNMVEDPSMTHETLSYTLHRALGVPAARTGFVYLRLNDEDFGVYMNVENYDAIAMAKKLGGFDGDVQHVYEGENGADVKPELLAGFEVDEGPDEIADLEALAAAVGDESSQPWSTVVGAHASLKEMTRMWAAEKYSGQLDGYAGGPGPDHPNNYYLATGTDGLFRMLPWGQDETWKEDNHLPFDGEAGVMFEKCLADSGCESLYEDALSTVQTTVPTLKLDTLAVCTAEMLAPWQQLEEEESERFEYDAGEIAAAVAETREFIASRPGELAGFLGNTAPSEPAPVNTCPASGPEPGPGGGSVTYQVEMPPPTEQVVASRAGTLGRIARNGKRLRVGVFSPAAGLQKLTAKIAGRRGARVCSRHTLVPAGKTTLSCRLSGVALEALRDGPLRLIVSVRIPTDPEPLTRRVRLPRL